MSLQFAFSKRAALEPEMRSYMALSGISGDYWTINNRIKAIKYGSGVTLSSVTANLSTVNGTAFVSNPSVDLRPYANNWKISFTDTGAATAYFYGKAAGTGEALGAEKVPDPGFDNASAWSAGAGWVVSGGVATATTSAAALNTNPAYFAVTIGALYKGSLTVTSYTGPGTYVFGRVGDNDVYTTSQSSSGIKTFYGTQISATTQIDIRRDLVVGTEITLAASDVSLKQVTAPSATGITGTSTAGGSTFNWADIGVGFNPNSATFTVLIEKE